MTNLFEVLELICSFLNIASLVVICVGWLTCSDYYYKITSFNDGMPLVMHIEFGSAISIPTILIGIAFDGFGKAPYINMGYVLLILIIIFFIFSYTKILKLRQYFANKRGRYI